MKHHRSHVERWRNAPRLTSLFGAFDKIASGKSGAPVYGHVAADAALFAGRCDIQAFHDTYLQFSGTFNAHFLASIPYVLEEECRLGAAVARYLTDLARTEGRLTTLQTIGNAEAVIARTIVARSGGAVNSLSNSPTKANHLEFLRNRPPGSYFFHGPFFDLNTRLYARDHGAPQFEQPFDIVYEDTTFQMYGPDRDYQVPFVLKNLRQDGIFVCLEKCRLKDEDEYIRREMQKDLEFKRKYFMAEQIKKKAQILNEMENGQVYLEHLVAAIVQHLPHVELTWNSGNFYMLAASASRAALDRFVAHLGPPCIPDEFSPERPRCIV